MGDDRIPSQKGFGAVNGGRPDEFTDIPPHPEECKQEYSAYSCVFGSFELVPFFLDC